MKEADREIVAALDTLYDTGRLTECRGCDHFIGYADCDVFLSMSGVVCSEALRPDGRCRACTVEVE